MGRRAKNKQGAPEPLADANGQVGRPSAKKLGKRKADVDDDARDAVSKRPAKKLKEAEAQKGALAKKGAERKGKAVPKASAKKKKQEESEDEDEEDGVMEGGSSGSEGWENVEEDHGVKTEARYAVMFFWLCCALNVRMRRSLFRDSDEEEDLEGFSGDLDEIDVDGEGDEYVSPPAAAIEFAPIGL